MPEEEEEEEEKEEEEGNKLLFLTDLMFTSSRAFLMLLRPFSLPLDLGEASVPGAHSETAKYQL